MLTLSISVFQFFFSFSRVTGVSQEVQESLGSQDFKWVITGWSITVICLVLLCLYKLFYFTHLQGPPGLPGQKVKISTHTFCDFVTNALNVKNWLKKYNLIFKVWIQFFKLCPPPARNKRRPDCHLLSYCLIFII